MGKLLWPLPELTVGRGLKCTEAAPATDISVPYGERAQTWRKPWASVFQLQNEATATNHLYVPDTAHTQSLGSGVHPPATAILMLRLYLPFEPNIN